MRIVRELAAESFVMAAIGLVLGVLGPLGTYGLPVMLRVPAWILLGFTGYAFFRPVLAAGLAMHERTGTPRLAAVAVACAVAAVPTTILVSLIFAWLRIGRVSPQAWAESYPSVLLVGAIATAIQLALFRPSAAALDPMVEASATPATIAPSPASAPTYAAPAPAAPAHPAFLDRLPPAERGRLLCLEMEDHYVRAHTAGGSILVLMRMRDAVGELAGVDGMRVHRSWWVARDAVAEVLRLDRAIQLRLANGLEVPVARNAAPALRAAGWL